MINKNDCRKYSDHKLLISQNVNGQKIDLMRRNIIKTFKYIVKIFALPSTILGSTNLKTLDV